MTNSYHLLLPSLLVCSLSYLLAQRWTIYEKQVKSRIESPAHAGDFFVDILQTIRVRDLMHRVRKVTLIPEGMCFLDFKKFFSETKQHYFPVMDDQGRLSGIFSINDVRSVLFAEEIERLVCVKDIATSEIITTNPEEDLNTVLQKFTTRNIDSLPVVQAQDPKNLIGMLNRREVISFYNDKVADLKGKARGV